MNLLEIIHKNKQMCHYNLNEKQIIRKKVTKTAFTKFKNEIIF